MQREAQVEASKGVTLVGRISAGRSQEYGRTNLTSNYWPCTAANDTDAPLRDDIEMSESHLAGGTGRVSVQAGEEARPAKGVST